MSRPAWGGPPLEREGAQGSQASWAPGPSQVQAWRQQRDLRGALGPGRPEGHRPCGAAGRSPGGGRGAAGAGGAPRAGVPGPLQSRQGTRESGRLRTGGGPQALACLPQPSPQSLSLPEGRTPQTANRKPCRTSTISLAAKIAGLYDDSEPPQKTVRRGVLMTLLQQSAMTLPLWIGKPGDKPPPLCGAIPASGDYVTRPGDKVAAQVKAVDGDEQWILAEVISYSHATNKYEVDDIDEEGKDQETHPELAPDHPAAPVEGQPQDTP
ncbi:collagen, type I, alpha 1b-like [Pongo pygmaeus]|uniref:collagen, type I, alpha 1b-like n=1 Tax=Pongo pygmaeus TaxID=9600 RepID=UPI00300C6D42